MPTNWNVNNTPFGVEIEVHRISVERGEQLALQFTEQLQKLQTLSSPDYRLTGSDREFLQSHNITREHLPSIHQAFEATKQAGFSFERHNLRWKAVSDGSLGSAAHDCEIVSPPLTRGLIPHVQSVTRQIRTAGGQMSEKTGLHIHVDARPLSTQTNQGYTATAALHRVVRNWFEMQWGVEEGAKQWNASYGSRESRLTNHYSPALSRAEVDHLNTSNIHWTTGSWAAPEGVSVGRYRSLNLHALSKHNTIEFRMFKGTLHAGEMKANIELLLHLVDHSVHNTATLDQTPGVNPVNEQLFTNLRQGRDPTTLPRQLAEEPENHYCRLLTIGLQGRDAATVRQHLVKGFVEHLPEEQQSDALRAFHAAARHRLEQARQRVSAPTPQQNQPSVASNLSTDARREQNNAEQQNHPVEQPAFSTSAPPPPHPWPSTTFIPSQPLTPQSARGLVDLSNGWSQPSRNGTIHRVFPSGNRDTRPGSTHWVDTGTPDTLADRALQSHLVNELAPASLRLNTRMCRFRNGQYGLMQSYQTRAASEHRGDIATQTSFVNHLVASLGQQQGNQWSPPEHHGLVLREVRDGLAHRLGELTHGHARDATATIRHLMLNHWDKVEPIVHKLFNSTSLQDRGIESAVLGVPQIGQTQTAAQSAVKLKDNIVKLRHTVISVLAREQHLPDAIRESFRRNQHYYQIPPSSMLSIDAIINGNR